MEPARLRRHVEQRGLHPQRLLAADKVVERVLDPVAAARQPVRGEKGEELVDVAGQGEVIVVGAVPALDDIGNEAALGLELRHGGELAMDNDADGLELLQDAACQAVAGAVVEYFEITEAEQIAVVA
jgi:hypothetical protein